MTQLAEVVVTTDQATLLGAAADVAIRANEAEEYIQLEEAEVHLLQQLVVFMAMVASEPGRFPVTGRMAKSIREAVKGVKGPAQPQSRRNKRKARQEQRQSHHKRRRKERRERAPAYNEARARVEAEMEEARQIQEQRQAEIENEPKFEVTDIMGNVIFSGIPQSMLRPVELPERTPEEDAALTESGFAPPTSAGRIIMPGSAEALQAQLEHQG